MAGEGHCGVGEALGCACPVVRRAEQNCDRSAIVVGTVGLGTGKSNTKQHNIIHTSTCAHTQRGHGGSMNNIHDHIQSIPVKVLTDPCRSSI